MMRLAVAVVLVGLGVAVVTVLMYQAGQQELDLHNLKTRMLKNSAEVKRKEQSIDELKTQIQEITTTRVSIETKIDELKKNKKERETIVEDLSKSLQTCSKEKADTETKKSVTGEAIVKLKADHTVAKENAERDIQQLKKQILERDKAICLFADTTKEEARKLCAISEDQK